MATVTKEFVYYDDGCFPTVHAVGEDVNGDVAAYAISQGFAGELLPLLPVAFTAKHIGGGSWQVINADGEMVAEGLKKDEAKAKADELNTAASTEE